MRARAEGLKDKPSWNGEGMGMQNVSGYLERSRIVSFHPSFSLQNAFILDKSAFYRDVLADAVDILKPAAELVFPLVEGGNIYVEASEEFHNLSLIHI